MFYLSGWNINQEYDGTHDINDVENDSSKIESMSTDDMDATKNVDATKRKEKKKTTNTDKDDEFFDTSMNETSELEDTSIKNDSEQNETTNNELGDDGTNSMNENDIENNTDTDTDTDDMNVATSIFFCDGATDNNLFLPFKLGILDKTSLKS